MGFQENALRKVRKIHLWGVGSTGAKKVCFEDLSKDMFLKSKMENVDKYRVYLDILLVVSIYVTTHCFFKEHPEIDPPVILS